MPPQQGDDPNTRRGRQPQNQPSSRQQPPGQGQPSQQPPTQQGQRGQSGGFQGQQPPSRGQREQPPTGAGGPSSPQMTGGGGMGSQQPPGMQTQQPPGMQTQQPGMQTQQRGMSSQPGGQPQQPGMQTQPPGMQTQQPPGMQTQPPGMQQPGMRAGRMPMEPVTIEEIVETDVVTVERDDTVPTIVSRLRENDVGSAIVVDDGSPIGIITDRKIALSIEDADDISEMTADDLIDGELVTATTDMTIFDAIERLSDENIRRLPVVDDNGNLEGIITLDDVLVLIGTELERATEVIKAQSPRL